MKQKRGLLLASGIIFVVIAVLYFITSLVIIPIFDTLILPIIEEEIEELILIGEAELANEIRNSIDLVQNGILVSFIIMAIVDLVLGILLIKHSKANEQILVEKKGLVITSIVVSLFTSGIIVAILLIISLITKVELVTEQTQTISQPTVDNMDQTQINEKYETKIRRLQELRDKGAITKEEYQKLLKQIFEE